MLNVLHTQSHLMLTPTYGALLSPMLTQKLQF